MCSLASFTSCSHKCKQISIKYIFAKSFERLEVLTVISNYTSVNSFTDLYSTKAARQPGHQNVKIKNYLCGFLSATARQLLGHKHQFAETILQE